MCLQLFSQRDMKLWPYIFNKLRGTRSRRVSWYAFWSKSCQEERNLQKFPPFEIVLTLNLKGMKKNMINGSCQGSVSLPKYNNSLCLCSDFVSLQWFPPDHHSRTKQCAQIFNHLPAIHEPYTYFHHTLGMKTTLPCQIKREWVIFLSGFSL